jgi:plasmid stability protein
MDPFWFQNDNMPNLSIKDVPPAWAEALRQRALQHHRSLQGELMAILEQALTNVSEEAKVPTEPPAQPVPRASRVDAHGRPVQRQGSKTLAQVRQELLARYPQAITAQASSVALIREARDSR